ncbi:hypothetical protein ACX0G9_19755 [Flavitalea flava]
MNCITASCIIGDAMVIKNGETVFTRKDLHESGQPSQSGQPVQPGLNGFLLSLYLFFDLNYPRFYKMDNLSKLGWLTTEILLKEGFNPGNYRAEGIGLVLSNAHASLDTDIKYFDTVKDISSPSLFVYTLPNIMIGEICIRNKFKGEHAFFISDHFDAGFMQEYVNNLMDDELLQACIFGWVDLLGEEYKAALFLVEKKKEGEDDLLTAGQLDFTEEQIRRLFHGENTEKTRRKQDKKQGR